MIDAFDVFQVEWSGVQVVEGERGRGGDVWREREMRFAPPSTHIPRLSDLCLQKLHYLPLVLRFTSVQVSSDKIRTLSIFQYIVEADEWLPVANCLSPLRHGSPYHPLYFLCVVSRRMCVDLLSTFGS